MRRISPSGFRVARRGTFREINRQIALNLIRDRQPISRADLARLMGVRRGAVSRLVHDLLRAGLVFEGAKGESRGGRRPMHLFIETRRRCALAVDVSASRTSLLVTDLLGSPLLPVLDFPTPRRPQALIRRLVGAIRHALAGYRGGCAGIGVVVTGVVAPDGAWTYAPTLGWRNVDLLGPLRRATRLPVAVENSVKACVLAQVWAVPGDAPVDGAVAFVNVSDGVGVGIAIDGKLLRGAHNLAGELGHVTLDPKGPRCSCGRRGCWEAFAAKRATIARYLGADPSWPASAKLRGVTMESIVSRARAGEKRALAALRETGRYLGLGFAAIIKALDPKRVYVGGEITLGWDLITTAVRQALREQALVGEAGQTEILTVPLGEHPRLRGAAALVSAPAFAAPVVA
jgi:predicted NBD/HSP70 family sugar kinase